MTTNIKATILLVSILTILMILPIIGYIIAALVLLYMFYLWLIQPPLVSVTPLTDALYEDAILANFIHMKFHYMKSDQWQDKRKLLLSIKPRCELCGSKHHLHIHHTSGYDLIPNEPLSCLSVLCESCHSYQHEHYGFPKSYDAYMNWNAPLVARHV